MWVDVFSSGFLCSNFYFRICFFHAPHSSFVYNSIGIYFFMSFSESWRTAKPVSGLDQPRPPKSPILNWLRAWWPALLWAILISVLSTNSFSAEHTSLVIEPIFRWLFPHITQDTLDLLHHLVRKSAHFTEYFIFALLLYHGMRASHRDDRPWHWSWALVAWLIAAIYSAFDEIHQIFVPSRGPSVWDSMLDSAGALFALLVLFFLYRRYLRSRPT
jgi:VanZ family protein